MGLNQGGHSFALRALPSAFDSMPTHDYHPLCCTAQVHALTSSHAPGPFSMHPGIVGPHGGARPPLPWPAMTPDGLAGLAGHSELPPPPPGMTTHERLSQLLETEIVLTSPDAQPQTIPYPLLIFLSIKSLIRKHPIGGIRLEKVHVFLTNVISVSSSKKVKDEAMNIASALPRSRIPKAMLF